MSPKRPNFDVVRIETIAHLMDSAEQPKPDTGQRSILSISYNPNLLATREMILVAAGYKVRSVRELEAALAEAAFKHYDLVIIGHSISIENRRMILKQVRKHSKALVLALWKAGPEEILNAADYYLEASEGPIALMDMVREIFRHRDGVAKRKGNSKT